MSAVERIAEATKSTKWEGRLFLVGGAVRDPLLGLPAPKDCDITLEGDAVELARYLRKAGVSSIPPVIYPRFGTALVRVNNSNVEIASARVESYDPSSRKPRVRKGSLLEDVKRRDFTINALLKNIHTGELLDLLGNGLSDLKKRILRTPLDPKLTFRDDPLRMLRAIRFKNRFGLKPARGLLDAIRTERERLEIVSMERIRDEFTQMLLHNTAAKSLKDLMNLGLLPMFIPQLAEGIEVKQGSYHKKDVWRHTLDVVEKAANAEYEDQYTRLIVTLAALLHDVGKPRTKSREPNGRIRFIGHEKLGKEMAAAITRNLRFNRHTCADVAALVGSHMRLGSAIPFTKSAARRLVRDLGPLTMPLIWLCEADASALGRTPKGIDFNQVRAIIAEVQSDQKQAPLESPLSGQEIMRLLGIPEGREVGRWKAVLTKAVLDGEIPPGDKDKAADLLLRLRCNHQTPR